MPNSDQSDFYWLEFDKEGRLDEPDAYDRLKAALIAKGATDLVIMSHGWKNDRQAALRIRSAAANSAQTTTATP